MSLALLRRALPPPIAPTETTGTENWSSVEASLGTRVPEDYKGFIDVYGTGVIGDFLWVFNPFSRRKYVNLHTQVRAQLDAIEDLDGKPYPLYPKPGGLLPWGLTDNGNALYWLTAGDPVAWQVVINESRGPEFERHNVSLTGFLTGVITGAIVSKLFPGDFLDRAITFQPGCT